MASNSLEQDLESARHHQRLGQFDEAASAYHRVLEKNPDHAGALYELGQLETEKHRLKAGVDFCLSKAGLDYTCRDSQEQTMASSLVERLYETAQQKHARGQFSEAAVEYQRVLAKNPNHAGALHKLGLLETRANRLDEAVGFYRRALAVKPEWPDALHELGCILYNQKNLSEALDCLQRSVALEPGRQEFLLNLATMRSTNGQDDCAIALYRKSLSLKPDAPMIRFRLAMALHKSGLLDEAIVEYGRAIVLKPDHALAYYNLGIALQALLRFPEAVAVFRKTSDLDPTLHNAQFHRGRMLAKMGNREEAIDAFRKGLALDPPQRVELEFELAAIECNSAVRTAPAEYVLAIYNHTASVFDHHLVEELHYRAPELLFNAVAAVDSRENIDILDLGCGTGLSGVHFRPRARRLVGVDLAAAMIERARQRQLYDELVVGDVTEALLARPGQWDLILAVDVFVYVGELNGVFPAAAAALRPGGLFAFSVEQYHGVDFALHEQRRFAHSLQYIRGLARQSSLEEINLSAVVLRQEKAKDVHGWVFVLRKTA